MAMTSHTNNRILEKIQHIRNSSHPHPCIVGVCWAGLWWGEEGRQFCSITMGALKTGSFTSRWEKGETACVHSASSFPSACSQNRSTWVQRQGHGGDAEGMGMIPRASANGAAPLLTLRAASSSPTLPLAQTYLPCISPSLGTHVVCRIGAELISFPKHPHKPPRGKQIKSPALTCPRLWASSLRSGKTLPC